MTFVAVKMFERRTLIVSDTRITDPGKANRAGLGHRKFDNSIPGRIKAVVINPRLTVAYAGKALRALDTLRAVSVLSSGNLPFVLDKLKEGSGDGEVDFLVAADLEGSQIFKISEGRVSTGQDFYWIGDPMAAGHFNLSLENTRVSQKQFAERMRQQNPDDPQIEERAFSRAWGDLLLGSPNLIPGVGGIPITVNASPRGHHYCVSAGACMGENVRVMGDGRWLNDDNIEVEPLYGQTSYSIVASAHSGAAAVGVWLQEINAGYIYIPLDHDDPVRVSSMKELSELVRTNAERLGGVPFT